VKFELLLYKEFYVDSGRAHAKSESKVDPFYFGPQDLSEDGLFQFADTYTTLPTGVCEHIRDRKGGRLVYEPWYKNSLPAKKEQRDAQIMAGLEDALLNGPATPQSMRSMR
jgi:hypothetical protein